MLEPGGAAFEHPEPGAAPPAGSPRHSAELLPELDRLLTAAGKRFEDIEAICVGVGPGTFTGLRIGIATARGLGQALGVSLRPVSSLAAIGLALASEGPERPLLAAIDARRGELFCALYRSAPDAAGGPGLTPVWEEACLAPEDLAARLDREAPSLAGRALAAGDGSIQFRAVLEAAGVEIPPDSSVLHTPRALMVCRLAEAVEGVEPRLVTPTYLRLPDAELSLRKHVKS